VPALLASIEGTLDQISFAWHDQAALAVVMAAKGYPGSYEKGTIIRGLENIAEEKIHIFHAGTAKKDGKIIATGGRVLNVTARGNSVTEARDLAYQAVSRIDWENGFYRSDIGWRAIAREKAQR